ARLSLKKMSGLAGVSIPYLSQIERGLRKPSADILQAIAKGLRISAETLYVQAGILDERATPDVAAAIMADPTITERQKQALIQIYQAFQEEAGRIPPLAADPGHERGAARTRAIKGGTTRRRAQKRGGRVESQAVRSPHPAPLRSPATKPRKEV
ncbi:MAG TPA: helix-turn-helix transcriptional regulator, partial [Actinomycetota bacterium]|nr:helix-turn-helix transcriptional regulator [Actinomycetota bacterium]